MKVIKYLTVLYAGGLLSSSWLLLIDFWATILWPYTICRVWYDMLM